MKNMFISDYTENEFNKKDQECKQLLGKIKKLVADAENQGLV